jgi:hypothetical protein
VGDRRGGQFDERVLCGPIEKLKLQGAMRAQQDAMGGEHGPEASPILARSVPSPEARAELKN